MTREKSITKILQYLLLTFSISWLSWAVLIIAGKYRIIEAGSLLYYIIFTIGGFGPPIATYALLKQWKKISGIRDFLKFVFDAKKAVVYYMIVLLFIICHFFISYILGGTNKGLPFYYGLIYIPLMFIWGGVEEIGWRGVLVPTLAKKLHFIPTTIITAIIWSCWHIPLWFLRGSSQFGTSFAIFALQILAISFSLTAIRLTTGSVFLCIIYHTCINAFYNVYVLQPRTGTIIAFVLEALVAIILCFVVKRKNKSFV